MDKERWERIKDILETVVELSPDERHSFLEKECRDDTALRSEAEALLEHHESAGSFLEGISSYGFSPTLNFGQPLFATGQTLSGRFRIFRFIGRGGMGEVYEAEDLKLGTRVALKTLRFEISSDAWAINRFKQEIYLARRVSHPNVCRMFDIVGLHADNRVENHGGDPVFITMELLKGESLAEFLRRKIRVSLEEARPLIRQMADALQAAHEAGVIHRDFKPANVVLVSPKGSSAEGIRAVVTDFGLAHATTGSSPTGESFLQSMSRTGQILGTLAYMAPEQLEGQDVTPATDVYALGLVIYEMLTGHTPFPEHAPLAGAFLRVKEQPPSPRAYLPDLDIACEQTIMRCLRVEPSGRFQSAGEVATNMLLLLGTNVPSRPSSTKERSFGASAKRGWVAVAAALFVLVSTTALGWALRDLGKSSLPPVEVTPLLAMPGKQVTPAFSPDGKEIAFAVQEGRAGIYSMPLGTEKPIQLTEHPLGLSPYPRDCCPTWSPDGRQIAFIREDSERKRSFYVIPSLGGSEHRLYTDTGTFLFNYNRLDWSPDGGALAFSEFREKDKGYGGSRIASLSLRDVTTKQLTSPPEQEGDREPVFSPDGSSVAFIRWPLGGPNGDVFVVSVSGGNPRRLTFDNSCTTPTWTQDGKEIVFSSTTAGLRSLWRVPVSGGTPQPITGIGEMAMSPAVAPKGNQLAYLHFALRNSIWQLTLKDEKHASGHPAQRFSSRGINWRPSFSPDGKMVAFESDRMGFSDIWYCAADGSNCKQLTSLHATSGTARWSPDGRYIAFESQSQGHYDVYVVEVLAGKPRLVSTLPGASNGAASWSRDGQWIYFYSTKGKEHFQLWKVPFKGGAPVRVTRNGGVYGVESYDGRFLYYSKFEEPGLWRMPLVGGGETKILDQPPGWAWFDWGLTRTGIYFLDLGVKPYGRIEFFDFRTLKKFPVFCLEKPAPGYVGLAVAPDGRSILFGQTELDDSYIMLVKNFR
jgi:Tol biopolymer transport system component/serine/threonine protein kinase